MAATLKYLWRWVRFPDNSMSSSVIATSNFLFDGRDECLKNAYCNLPTIDIHSPPSHICLFFTIYNYDTAEETEQYIEKLY